MKTVQSAVADLLYMHDWERTACKCGWVSSGAVDHVDHLAEILTDAFAIVARRPSLLAAE